MLKVLISAACIAVIAIAGLLFWQAKQRAEVRHSYAEWQSCQNELANLAPMNPGPKADEVTRHLVKCRLSGLITGKQWDHKLASMR